MDQPEVVDMRFGLAIMDGCRRRLFLWMASETSIIFNLLSATTREQERTFSEQHSIDILIDA